jgi:hypothetical protein
MLALERDFIVVSVSVYLQVPLAVIAGQLEQPRAPERCTMSDSNSGFILNGRELRSDFFVKSRRSN